METRRRFPPPSCTSPSPASTLRSLPAAPRSSGDRIQASDALPIPIRHTNLLFSLLFVCSIVFLMRRWRDKVRESIPLHAVDLSELVSIISVVASLIYLISFFGIAIVQSIVSSHEDEVDDFLPDSKMTPSPAPSSDLASPVLAGLEDEDIIAAVVAGKTPSYALESAIGDCHRAAEIRREAIRRISGRGLDGLPLEGFDYGSILGQCCEMPVGYVQLPVGIAGPLILDGREHYLPMATTEGCLVASTNRGCKAIAESGGAASVVLRDAMTRAPVVRFLTAARAAELKFFLEEPTNFDNLSVIFNR
ncbi:3-hydroxy-3-methylglutaryl-coenzyme A reductase [Dendrobium catenatum]|uniref:3-hydroxy-3-methylglutaryl-coenzyme A reductase n=3 Tax=Dendrobium catenatum TaxID=906689 RepID=A0A2I0VUZ2_9ASPA|nr:3-hydroxy-3-methylglutaryl-coenzyme A reductase [Dendrobium catenatum]